MSKVIISTLLIMGATFIIGFVVAYIIKLISTTLNYFENFSLATEITKWRRFMLIKKVHQYNMNELLLKAQSELNDELLEYHYPSQSEKKEEFDYLTENELTRYRYGKN